MILLIDNYDSFTFNLYQYLGELGQTVQVRRNDQIHLDEVKQIKPSHIVFSPGPGRPENAGMMPELILQFYKTIPLLGICLGHQAMGLVMGGQVIHAPELVHGKSSVITHDGKGVFRGLQPTLEVGRYHSLVVSESGFPSQLDVTSRTANGLIMGLRHREYPMEGIQFHPESVLTPQGKAMLANFIQGKR